MPVRFGLSVPNRGVVIGAGDPKDLVAMCEAADASELFDAVFTGDNLISKPRLDAIVFLSLVAGRTRRIAAFYGLAGIAYFVLAFGSASPLFWLYSRLPLASLFRAPVRFIWVTGFCLAVLAGLGADALTGASRVGGRSFVSR